MTPAIPARTITVSGYPPIPALEVFAGSYCVMTVASRAGVTTVAVAIPTVTWGGIRCNRCHSWAHWTGGTDDNRLGFTGYCKGCVETLATACLQKHGRLPTPATEFFCASCLEIRPIKDRPEDNGQARYRCRACRRAQLEVAEKKYRAKAKAKGKIRAA